MRKLSQFLAWAVVGASIGVIGYWLYLEYEAHVEAEARQRAVRAYFQGLPDQALMVP